MNKALMGAGVFLLGLLLVCAKVEATETEGGTLYLMNKAGFTEYVANIECEPTTYVLTEEEKDMLKRLGVLEGGEEDVEGIAHVMQVVLNRRDSELFPDTVEGVIFQKHPTQFTTAKRLAKANVTEAAEEALNQVVYGQYTDNEALYFESLSGKAWASVHEYLFSYGGHDFYNQ